MTFVPSQYAMYPPIRTWENYGTYPLKVWKKLGVSGPRGAPFVGNIFQLFDRKTGLRHCFKEWQDKYGRIFGFTFFRHPVLVVSDLEALRQILVKDFHNYVNRFDGGSNFIHPQLKKGVVFIGGVDWQRIRRIISPTFSSGKLRLLTQHINVTARKLADFLSEKAEAGIEVDAKKAFGAYSLDVTAGTAFGLDLDTQNNPDNIFMTHATNVMNIKPIIKVWTVLLGIFPFLRRVFLVLNVGFFDNAAVSYFQNQMRSLIEERKTHPEQFKQVDFIQLLMDAEADPSDEIIGSKKLSLEEVAAQCIVFVIAGYETTSAALQYLTYELSRHQEEQAKIAAEIEEIIGDDEEATYENCQKLKYTEAVINEIVRMYPPIHFVTRASNPNHTVSLQGFQIPPDTRIMIPIYGIGRDPEYFEDPDTFNPDRFLGKNKNKIDTVSFLPFGLGPRHCIGMRMGMLTLKIGLVHILRKFSVVSTSPKILEINDFTGVLQVNGDIKVKLAIKA